MNAPLVNLRVQQRMPPADLLAFAFLHFLPMLLLLLPTAVLTQSNPANHLFTLHSAPAINCNHQGNIRELEEGHLEDKGLFIDRIGLATPNRRLAAGHLLTHTIEEEEFSICIYSKNKQEEDEKTMRVLCRALALLQHLHGLISLFSGIPPTWSLLLDHHILYRLLRKRIIALYVYSFIQLAAWHTCKVH